MMLEEAYEIEIGGTTMGGLDIGGLVAKIMPIMMLSTVMGSLGGGAMGGMFKKIMPLIMMATMLPMLGGMFGGGGGF